MTQLKQRLVQLEVLRYDPEQEADLYQAPAMRHTPVH